MAERFLKDGTYVRQYHLHLPVPLFERCRAIARAQGFRHLSNWVVMILSASADAAEGREVKIPDRGEEP